MAKLTGLLARLDTRNCVFSGGPDIPREGEYFYGGTLSVMWTFIKIL